jgi:hypothetical protein
MFVAKYADQDAVIAGVLRLDTEAIRWSADLNIHGVRGSKYAAEGERTHRYVPQFTPARHASTRATAPVPRTAPTVAVLVLSARVAVSARRACRLEVDSINTVAIKWVQNLPDQRSIGASPSVGAA